MSEKAKSILREQYAGLDPVRLLRDIRAAQQILSNIATHGPREELVNSPVADMSTFLSSLSTAWKDGEVRPTHQTKKRAPRWWRTRADPFAQAWPVVQGWLISEPTVTAKEMLNRLSRMVPEIYASKGQLRTLQRRVGAWRAEVAKDLVLGKLRQTTNLEAVNRKSDNQKM